MLDQRTNSLALTSLICGILSWIALPFLGSIVAVVTGHIALRQMRSFGGESGEGLAYIGLGLGYFNLIGFALGAIAILLLIGFLGLAGATAACFGC